MRTRQVPVLSCLVALVLAGSGCTGGGDDAGPGAGGGASVSTAAPLPDRATLAAGLADLYAGAGTVRDGEQAAATCFAGALLDRVEPGDLASSGLVEGGEVVTSAPRLPRTVAEQWFAAQQSCADYVEVSARAQRGASKGRIDEEAYATCLRDAIAPGTIESGVVAALMGSFDDPAVAALSTAQARCAREALPASGN